MARKGQLCRGDLNKARDEATWINFGGYILGIGTAIAKTQEGAFLECSRNS